MKWRVWGLMGGVIFCALTANGVFASDVAMPDARKVSEIASTGPKAALDPGFLRSPRPRPAGADGATRSEQCRWLGQRIVSLLSRDDAMTAKDFNPFYDRFGCSMEHLAEAFGCVVSTDGQVQGEELASRVDRCWADPIEARRSSDVMGDEMPVENGREDGPGGT
jgi:hypothetical protein